MENENRYEMVLLFDIYGEALSETCRLAFDLHCNEDLSLAEISENLSITRQGARDAIKRGENELIRLENAIGAAKRAKEIRKTASEISAYIKNGEYEKALEKSAYLERL